MMISHEHRFVFVSTPKAGTHSMYELLGQYGAHRYGGYHETHLPPDVKGYYHFTTCRHPIDRLVAAWYSLLFHSDHRDAFVRHVGNDTLPAFLRWVMKHPNHRNLIGPGKMTITPQSVRLKHLRLDGVIRMERLAQDFANLPFVDAPVDIPHALSRPHPPWHVLIPEPLLHDVVRWLAPDFQCLPYERPELLKASA